MRSVKARMDAVFREAKVDAILLINTDREDSNFLYLTDFIGGLFEGTALIVKRNSMTLFVSPLEYGLAKRERPKEMKIVLLQKGMRIRDLLKNELKGLTVGINGSYMPVALYKRIKSKIGTKKLVDVSEQLLFARLVKEEAELKKMRHAVWITKQAIKKVQDSLKVGMSEKEVARMIDISMLSLGGTNSFSSIVAFDAGSAIPHYSPTDAKLKPNSIVLFDVGAKYLNYCGDISRTFMFMPDKKSEKHERFMDMYHVVKKAQALALNQIKAGGPASKPHITAAEFIDTYKGGIYKGKFVHSLGHSIGIDVHDGEGLYPSSKLRLKPNMVFSDEPGIYVEGFGGVRIEDDAVVGKKISKFM